MADTNSSSSSSGASGVVVPHKSESGLNYFLHPLVIMNMSDHYTRFRTQKQDPMVSVYGALLGTQSGRSIEIFNSFEINVSGERELTVNKELFITRQEQYKQVFPTYHFLGWYRSSFEAPAESDMALHKQLLEFNESPIYVQMLCGDAMLARSSALPIRLYETMMHVGTGAMRFVEAGLKIETAEAERIAVESVAKEEARNADIGSSAIVHLTSQKNALQMMRTRINVLTQYVEQVAAGTLPLDHNIMREIANLVSRLPDMSSEAFSKQIYEEYNGVLLTTYLSLFTKTTNTAADVP
ncbi:hypothetical protein RI367_002337 [Sorochytrium milnesiophthora]